MPKHLWTILCEKASIDRDTNNVTLIEVIDGLTLNVDAEQDLTKPLPAPIVLPITWALVSTYERNDLAMPEKAEGDVSIIAPSGRIARGASFEIDLTQGARMHCLLRIVGLPITEPGRHVIQIDVKSTDGQKLFSNDLALDVAFRH